MRSSALEYLLIHHAIKRNGDIRSGTMECTGCSNKYPVIMGRPTLLPNAVIKELLGKVRYRISGECDGQFR